MGHMDVLPVISKGFIIFFPVVVILLALAAFFRLFNRCVYDDSLRQDLLEDGKNVVKLGACIQSASCITGTL
jgi:hypothetical protein